MTRFSRRSLWLAARPAVLMTPLLLGACAMGPQHPTTPISLPSPVSETTIAPLNGTAQHVVPGAMVDPQWWHGFASPALDALIDRALAANTDIATAEANLRQAREGAKAANGARAPQIDVGYQAERQRTSDALANNLHDDNLYLYTLQTAQLSVSYPLDLFGGLKSQALSARASAEVAAHRRDAARTMVVANLVTAVIQHAQYTAQLVAARESVANGRSILDMLLKRQKLGDIGGAEIAAQQTALATAEGAIPALVRATDHQRSQIAMLTGVAPGSALPDLPTLEQLRLPAELPVGLPAQIVANRPDVRAAEAQVRGAGADVGVAIAARLPALQITGTAGGMAQRFGDMFMGDNPFFTLIGAITQPLFHGGQLLHKQRAAEAALDAAKAQYRGAVLTAFGDVQDALTGVTTDGAALDAATRASDAAERNLDFTQRQLELGGVGTLSLLNASNSAAQAAAQLVQARAARLIDTVALYQAVGGGVAASKGA
ncbi:efflux transporter outer membrane subunit [Sphingobium sufflavum]|uniref:efflux transporter outer membrane subunit n=1 Tax=Sphingobium sufflavum TaxID=1129547 RepID=UPI001F256829|nr:efflux transporter outer membrane subunit [Sphingobium sufflavum]MCE7795401.1 efflux transporter outer membrane subunit [Sphingobium sufflavum]